MIAWINENLKKENAWQQVDDIENGHEIFKNACYMKQKKNENSLNYSKATSRYSPA